MKRVMDITKPKAHLHSWRTYGECLIGRISEHVRQQDFKAHLQITSPIVSRPKTLKTGVEVETHNTIYILGAKYKKPVGQVRRRAEDVEKHDG